MKPQKNTLKPVKSTYINQSVKLASLIVVLLIALNMSAQNNTQNNSILGFSFFDKIPGLWNGPVYSDTPAGSFDVWYVDFRPVSASQVSQYFSLDTSAINYTSFFVVKHNDKLRIAMRTEGVFMNKGCVTYEVMDSVNEAKGYYRFSDFQAGEKRAYTELIFKKDKMIMQTYTNKFNKEKKLSLHSKYEARKADRKVAEIAIKDLDYPQAKMVKDFSTAFTNLTESIYYTFEYDPYPRAPQPYVGSVTVNIEIDKKLKVEKKHELFLVLTTEPLFDGLKYKKENLKYFSRHIHLPYDVRSYTFTNVHPGKYYLYSYNDINGDKKHKKGDYMSSNLNNIIDVPKEGNVQVNTLIDFVIP